MTGWVLKKGGGWFIRRCFGYECATCWWNSLSLSNSSNIDASIALLRTAISDFWVLLFFHFFPWTPWYPHLASWFSFPHHRWSAISIHSWIYRSQIPYICWGIAFSYLICALAWFICLPLSGWHLLLLYCNEWSLISSAIFLQWQFFAFFLFPPDSGTTSTSSKLPFFYCSGDTFWVLR